MTKIVDGAELLIPMAGLINKEDELARLAKEVAKIEGEIGRIESKLANEGFVARAPEAVIAKEREKLEGYAEAKAKLIEQPGGDRRAVILPPLATRQGAFFMKHPRLRFPLSRCY